MRGPKTGIRTQEQAHFPVGISADIQTYAAHTNRLSSARRAAHATTGDGRAKISAEISKQRLGARAPRESRAWERAERRRRTVHIGKTKNRQTIPARGPLICTHIRALISEGRLNVSPGRRPRLIVSVRACRSSAYKQSHVSTAVPAAAAHAPARARPAQGASRVNPRTDPPPRSTTRLFLAYPRWATARAQERRVGARPDRNSAGVSGWIRKSGRSGDNGGGSDKGYLIRVTMVIKWYL